MFASTGALSRSILLNALRLTHRFSSLSKAAILSSCVGEPLGSVRKVKLAHDVCVGSSRPLGAGIVLIRLSVLSSSSPFYPVGLQSTSPVVHSAHDTDVGLLDAGSWRTCSLAHGW